MLRVFSQRAWEDYLSWQSDNRSIKRINALVRAIEDDPFEGSGKVEALKEPLRGCWSRRIDATNRILYRISRRGKDDLLEILQMRYHR
jgi:toxin YoeB